MGLIISFLKDAETVAKFQRVCGIVVVDDTIYDKSSKEANGNSHCDAINGHLPRRRQTKSTNMQVDSNATLSVNGSNQTEIVSYVITCKTLYYLFLFGANLGNEIFYLTFFPFWFWNIDGCIGRQLSVFWCIFMFVGQSLKDVFKIPRPSSPPVVQLEEQYASEYGMPSTHAMVGAGIPFAVFFLTKERYIYPSELVLVGAILWCAVVSISRIYLGMHTVLDVVTGLGLTSVLLVTCLPNLDMVDDFLLHSKLGPFASVLVPVALVILYPTPTGSTRTRCDTAYILAAGSGISLGHWLSFQFGFMSLAVTPPPYEIIPPTWTWASLVIVRMVLGVSVLLGVRAIFAAFTRHVLGRITGKNRQKVEAAKYVDAIELSLKYITYCVLAVGMILVPPTLFNAVGIERETFFTEL